MVVWFTVGRQRRAANYNLTLGFSHISVAYEMLMVFGRDPTQTEILGQKALISSWWVKLQLTSAGRPPEPYKG